MSTLTKSRRMPAKYRVRAGGITEVVYSATPEVIVVLPGTRWLEERREREARAAAEAAQALAEMDYGAESTGCPTALMIDTELTAREPSIESEIAAELGCHTSQLPELDLSWTDRMRIASTKLMKRQTLWFSSVRSHNLLTTEK
jgi:hypothetical protein